MSHMEIVQAECKRSIMTALLPYAGRANTPELRSEILEAMVQAIRRPEMDGVRYSQRADGQLEIDGSGSLTWDEAARHVIAGDVDAIAEELAKARPSCPKVADVSTPTDREDGVMRFSITGLDPELVARIKAQEAADEAWVQAPLTTVEQVQVSEALVGEFVPLCDGDETEDDVRRSEDARAVEPGWVNNPLFGCEPEPDDA